jgi:hypothetical protein
MCRSIIIAVWRNVNAHVMGNIHFPVMFCNKSLRNQDYLKIHKQINTLERPFSCDVCNKLFTQTNQLKIHQNTVRNVHLCVISHSFNRVFWNNMNICIPGNGHIHVKCVIGHSVTGVLSRDIRAYIVGSMHIPVMYVISHSINWITSDSINKYIVKNVRIPVIYVIGHSALGVVWSGTGPYRAVGRHVFCVSVLKLCTEDQQPGSREQSWVASERWQFVVGHQESYYRELEEYILLKEWVFCARLDEKEYIYFHPSIYQPRETKYFVTRLC